MLVLSGVVVSALFSAFVSLATYLGGSRRHFAGHRLLADGLVRQRHADGRSRLPWCRPPFPCRCSLMRFRIDILSLGDEEARRSASPSSARAGWRWAASPASPRPASPIRGSSAGSGWSCRIRPHARRTRPCAAAAGLGGARGELHAVRRCDRPAPCPRPRSRSACSPPSSARRSSLAPAPKPRRRAG